VFHWWDWCGVCGRGRELLVRAAANPLCLWDLDEAEVWIKRGSFSIQFYEGGGSIRGDNWLRWCGSNTCAVDINWCPG